MLRKQTFWGGVHPAGRKELSSGAPLEDCPPPREVVIPLLQHIGKPCTPLVKAGDHVDMGQRSVTARDCASLFTPRCQAP